ncbi:VP1 [Cat Tien Hospitalitermes Lispi-like virus]|uniref:RNA-directed RNA polymerase L n=1 Tax=Cat Tien Hospitalitermes Lispi-like virus TaxID=2952743 RepID=A0AAE9SYF4_9MONO|nr:VP1 [Cat Tien Hospitalitermes Lispi-like virus]
MEDFLDEDAIFSRSSTQKIPDSHLQSPIRDVYRVFFHSHPSQWPTFIASCLRQIPIDRFRANINSEFCYGELLSCVYHYQSAEVLEWVTHSYPECCLAVSTFINITCEELHLPQPTHRSIPTDKDIILISMKVMWEDVRAIMQEIRISSERWVRIQNTPSGVDDMYVCSQFCIFTLSSTPESWNVMDYDQVMMIADTIAGRVFTLIYNDILSPNLPGKLPAHIIPTCYRLFDQTLKDYGNLAYMKIARWESICMAVLLSKFDRLQRAHSFLEWIQGELIKDHDTHGKRILGFLLEESLTVQMVAELHGLYRHWGHPTVHEEIGCEKVRDIAQHRPIPDIVVLTRMTGALKRQFVASFISKHGRWPRIINADTLAGKALQNLVIQQSRILNLYSPEYPLEDWGLLRFGKEFDFDYHPDYTDLLDDRSISVKRSEIRSIYSSDALGYKPNPPTSDRRVLKEVLKRPTVCVKHICDLVQRGMIPDEWKVIIVHAKERELKIAPRLFAMMTFEMRLYYSVTEANIKDHILKYFPQQTMTLDEADLSKRLYTLTSLPDELIKILSALLGIDFSSWNICWTFLSTFQVFQFLDDLFGTPGLYLQSHLFFEESLIALASHHNPPTSLISNPSGDPPECNELWYNHRGGFEGLRQKGWTLCTIGLLLLVESMTGLKSYIIGQGDNQVCKLMIPIPDKYDTVESYIMSEQTEISHKIDKFISTLKSLADSIGLHVKEEETWVGMDVLAYGKEILYKGAFMPQGLKRISRLLTDVNEIYPSLHTKVSTLQTAGMSCSQKSYDIVASYHMCTVEALMVISRDIYKMNISKRIPRNLAAYADTISFKEFLLCLSSDVGSCPLMSLISFLYRGHPDPLTTYTTWLSLLSNQNRIAQQMYTWLSKRCYQVGRGDCELLVSNPCSLNLNSPETISTKIRRDLEVALISYTRNYDLREIFTTASKQSDEELFQFLISLEPCHPRVAHEIFRNTITGSKLSFLSKFSNTRTTQAIFGEQPVSGNMLKVVQKLEVDQVMHWFEMYREILNVTISNNHQICPTNLAQIMRDDTWANATQGRPIEGVTIPHPAHQFTVCDSQNITDHLMHPSEKILFMSPTQLSPDMISTRGPYPAFIGSTTRERRSGKMYSIPQASRPLKSAERLIQLRDWMTHSKGSLHKYLTDLAISRTNMPVDILEDTTSSIAGGSVTHRLDDHVTKRGTLHNFRPNITTHIYYSTDTLGKFSRGQTNYNMHFQGAIHYGMSHFQLRVVHGSNNWTRHISLRYKGTCCEQKLDDFLLKSSFYPPPVQTSPTNPLLYATVGAIPASSSPSDTGMVKFEESKRPAEAIGFLLFSRCLSASNLYHIGLTESSNPLVSTVGVAEILGAGLYNILYHVAKYIFLLLPNDSSTADELFHSLHPKTFSDLAAICLLPDLLKELCSISGFTSMPELFCNKESICNLIKRLIERFVYDFTHEKVNVISEMMFTCYYPSSQIGLKRMLLMWCKQIWIATSGDIDIEPYVNCAFEKVSNQDLLPNLLFVQEVVNMIVQVADSDILRTICNICPFRLSSVPAQAVSRSARQLSRLSSFTLKAVSRCFNKHQRLSVRSLAKFGEKYICDVNCDLPFRTCEIRDLEWTKVISISVEKKRLDQTYRLLGTISTAFLKVYEIITSEEWDISGDVITLAEGEGSIAELLLRLGASSVYYNSLVNQKKLIEQRAPGLVPTCLLPFHNQVRMGALTAMTGGDLCELSTLTAILNYIPTENVCICTCDAESSGNLKPGISNKILLAWAAICAKSKSEKGLFKTFCHNTDILADTIGTALLVFTNVRLVVPRFSSHETYEVYLACSGSRGVVVIDDLISGYRNNQVVTVANVDALKATLQEVRRDRIHDFPLQDQILSQMPCLWKQCQDIGFEDNAASNLHRIVLFNSMYSGDNISDWLNKTEKTVYSRALKVIKLQSSSYFGTPIENIHPMYIPKHHVLHHQVESYMTCIINCRILRSILGAERESINSIISEHIRSDHELCVEDKVLYSYQIDPTIWRRAYLKNMCRLWGHWRYQRYHTCSISWSIG